MTHRDGDAKRPVSGRAVWDHDGVSESPERSPEESAHDILAAEAFAVPAPDPRLRHDLELPGDPAGIVEPHDILAAEEFAMPAPEVEARTQRSSPGQQRLRRSLGLSAGAFLAARWLRRRRR
jgi:hypothetical protein